MQVWPTLLLPRSFPIQYTAVVGVRGPLEANQGKVRPGAAACAMMVLLYYIPQAVRANMHALDTDECGIANTIQSWTGDAAILCVRTLPPTAQNPCVAAALALQALGCSTH